MLKSKSQDEINETLNSLNNKDKLKALFKHYVCRITHWSDHEKSIEDCLLKCSKFLNLDFAYDIDPPFYYDNNVRFVIKIFPGKTMVEEEFVITLTISARIEL